MALESPRWRSSLVQGGCGARWHPRRRRRPWSAEACFRFRFARRTHTDSHSQATAAEARAHLGPRPLHGKRQQAAAVQGGFAAAAEQFSPRRLWLHAGTPDAAGVPGVRELAPAFGSPGTPMPTPTGAGRPTPAEARAHLGPRPLHGKRQQAAAVQGGFAAVAEQSNPGRLRCTLATTGRSTG